MPHEELYNKIFGPTSNPREELKEIVNEYPYFSLAHFFLLKETPASDFNYRKIAAKTALHFNNAFMLKYQLNRKSRPQEMDKVVELTGEQKVVEAVELPIVEEVQKVKEIVQLKELQETKQPREAAISKPYEEPKQTIHIEEVKEVDEINNSIQPAPAEIDMPNKIPELEKALKPVISGNSDILFEPLHTTDYFASQGIKLSEEVQTGDKLGKQLKSFTDWLKTMKKLHHGKLPETNPTIDLAVQNLAEKSNKEEEVLTESMAEVYIQQGKADKALEIYKKLSLLNPAKNAYFAAKIEFLKEN